jgi:hypothetical protein
MFAMPLPVGREIHIQVEITSREIAIEDYEAYGMSYLF